MYEVLMYDCMSVWIYKYMNVWIYEYMNVGVHECMKIWMCECMNVSMNVNAYACTFWSGRILKYSDTSINEHNWFLVR